MYVLISCQQSVRQNHNEYFVMERQFSHHKSSTGSLHPPHLFGFFKSIYLDQTSRLPDEQVTQRRSRDALQSYLHAPLIRASER
jgi:hypothetical protein